MAAFCRYFSLLPYEEFIRLKQPNSVEFISEKVNFHAHQVPFVHLLEVEAYFVADLQTVVDWALQAKFSIGTSKLFEIELDITVERLLLAIDSAFLDLFVARRHELECEVLAKAPIAYRRNCDAVQLVPVVVSYFVIEHLAEFFCRNYSVEVRAAGLEPE